MEGIPVAPQLLQGMHGIRLLPADATAVLDVAPVSGVVVDQVRLAGEDLATQMTHHFGAGLPDVEDLNMEVQELFLREVEPAHRTHTDWFISQQQVAAGVFLVITHVCFLHMAQHVVLREFHA